MLMRRLRSLEDSGLLQRKIDIDAGVPRYRLTQAGAELFDVVKGLGDWGHKWVNHDIGPQDLDPDLLLWDMHRRINVEQLPDERVVAQIDTYGSHEKRYWLVFERPEPSVCYQDPELEVDVFMRADTLALHRIWMGRDDFVAAIKRGNIVLDGPRTYVRDLPSWFALSLFAGIPSSAQNILGTRA